MGTKRLQEGISKRSNAELEDYLKKRTVYVIDSTNNRKIKELPREKQPLPVRIAMDQRAYEKPFTMICYIVNSRGDLMDIRTSQMPIMTWRDAAKELEDESIKVHVLDITTQNGASVAFALKCKEQDMWFQKTDGEQWSEVKSWVK